MGGLGGDWLFEHVRRREIDVNAEEVGEPVLKSDHVEQGQAPGGIEVGNQIDIGRVRLGAGGGAVQAQMDDTGSPEFRFVPTQSSEHLLRVHNRTVPHQPMPGKAAFPPAGA